MAKLRILPDNIDIEVNDGENLMKAISKAGISINAGCGGRGTCGRCHVELVEGDVETEFTKKSEALSQGEVLSCKASVKGDVIINIPNDGRRLSKHKVLINEVELENPFQFNPIFKKITLTLDEPNLMNNTDDLSKLLMGLAKEVGTEEINLNLNIMRKLPEIVRAGNWEITVGVIFNEDTVEVIELEPGTGNKDYYGLAIDIGTTTVKINLINLADGQIIASGGDYNRQQKYGDDVINRIIFSAEEKNGLELVQKAVLDSINDLVQVMLTQHDIKPEEIYTSVVSGNTTMTHLFLGLPSNNIRLEPYIPAANFPVAVKGHELGLLMHGEGLIFNLPAVGSYVGGDITSGVLATQLNKRENISLFIDIGTNGEIVIGNQDWQMSCACSAGPCFEGGGIKFGMRAMDGAIDKIDISPEGEIYVQTINNRKPVGICGSGLIDVIATLLRARIINRTGGFDKNLNSPRLISGDEGLEFVLVWGAETEHGKDITILETDIINLIRAKGAIFAGIRSILKNVALTVEDIDEILIAGGFGNSLNIKDAVTIGMLPDVDLKKYRYVGNSSLKGACRVLTSREAYQEIMEFSKGMTYLELSLGNDFMDEFVSASFLPHTDLQLFPSAQEAAATV